MLSDSGYFLISYLIKDGLLQAPTPDPVFVALDAEDDYQKYALTDAGVAFCAKLRAAQQIQ